MKLFLRKDDSIELEAYKCFTKNRDMVHKRSQRGSRGVAVMIKTELLKLFYVEILDDKTQDILWLKLYNDIDVLCICVCYLPSENSVYNDCLAFYTKLLEQVYMYQNIGKLYIYMW